MGISRVARATIPRSVVRDLNPGTFAFVMATGIVSTGLLTHGVTTASVLLLLIGLAGYIVLLVASVWRLLRWRSRFVADLLSPNAFAFLTFAAGSNVLATRLALAGLDVAATLLLGIGFTAWLVLGYAVPLGLITAWRRQPGLEQVNGLWFLWVVAAQSVAVASGTLAALTARPALATLASLCWAVGLVLYPVLVALVLARLLLRPIAPDQLVPSYWVLMGAGAITVLAGAKLIKQQQADVLPDATVATLSTVQWAFCTWLVPLLLGLGVWRHLIRRVPLRYEPGLWGFVFPVGMYGVASVELGSATGNTWLSTLGGDEGWVAAAVWVTVFAGMIATAARRVAHRRRAR